MLHEFGFFLEHATNLKIRWKYWNIPDVWKFDWNTVCFVEFSVWYLVVCLYCIYKVVANFQAITTLNCAVKIFFHVRKIGRVFATMSEHSSNSNQSMPSPPPPPTIQAGDLPKVHRPKLKILAFHGYRQNGNVFKGKIGSFRKAVSKYAQLFFLSGPHKVLSEDGAGEEGRHLGDTS